MTIPYDLATVAITIAILAAAACLGISLSVRADRCLRLWAEDLGLTILDRRPAKFLRGPFTWSASRADFVHRVAVRDAKGLIREAWVRVPWMGLAPDKASVDVRWIEPTPRGSGTT